MENCSIGQSAVVWVRKPNFGSFYGGQQFVYQVWLWSDPPECFTFKLLRMIEKRVEFGQKKKKLTKQKEKFRVKNVKT